MGANKDLYCVSINTLNLELLKLFLKVFFKKSLHECGENRNMTNKSVKCSRATRRKL